MTSLQEASVTPHPSERRKHPRRPARGEVLLQPLAGSREISAKLMDISEGGFRAAHDGATLTSGDEVEFVHASGQGRAKVVWTKISEGAVESGFLILFD
jgi:PilZ domain